MPRVSKKTAVVNQLRSVRKMRRLTQVQLAEQLGYSPKTLKHWEQGTGMPTMRNLLNWCEGLGLDLTVKERADG